MEPKNPISSVDFFAWCHSSLTPFTQKCSGAGTLFARVRPLLIAAPCVIAAAWLSLLWWTKALFDEFGYVVRGASAFVIISKNHIT